MSHDLKIANEKFKKLLITFKKNKKFSEDDEIFLYLAYINGFKDGGDNEAPMIES